MKMKSMQILPECPTDESYLIRQKQSGFRIFLTITHNIWKLLGSKSLDRPGQSVYLNLHLLFTDQFNLLDVTRPTGLKPSEQKKGDHV